LAQAKALTQGESRKGSPLAWQQHDKALPGRAGFLLSWITGTGSCGQGHP
jgi:hypothetical protein